MGVTNTTTVLNVADHELGVAWCSDLFGREPDRRPMDGSPEGQLTYTSSVMVYNDADAAGGGNLIVGVDDLDQAPPPPPSSTNAKSSSSRTPCPPPSSGWPRSPTRPGTP